MCFGYFIVNNYWIELFLRNNCKSFFVMEHIHWVALLSLLNGSPNSILANFNTLLTTFVILVIFMSTLVNSDQRQTRWLLIWKSMISLWKTMNLKMRFFSDLLFCDNNISTDLKFYSPKEKFLGSWDWLFLKQGPETTKDWKQSKVISSNSI